MEKLDKLNHSPEFREYMTYEEDQRKIFNTKIKEAKEEGITEEKIKIAKSMLKENIPIDQILKITRLNIEEIDKIKEEIESEK